MVMGTKCSTEKESFLYFGYGSNLLGERLRLKNPSAEFVTTAVLKDYRLTFTNFGKNPYKSRWKGAGANIQEAQSEHVWGCVWKIGNQHRKTLDRQEGTYTPIEVKVTGNDGIVHVCRTYTTKDGDPKLDNRPSSFYMEVIIQGAKQNDICDEYIKFLENIERNSVTEIPKVYLDTMKLLNKPID